MVRRRVAHQPNAVWSMLADTASIRLPRLPKIHQWIQDNNKGDQLIPFSVALEERLLALGSPDAEAEELKKLGPNVTGALGKITTAGYSGLDLIKYYTCGPDEVRAVSREFDGAAASRPFLIDSTPFTRTQWTIRQGLKAPQAAGVIHSDFEQKFVCGEIMSFDDLKEYGNEGAVKAAGKYNQKGKTYEVSCDCLLSYPHQLSELTSYTSRRGIDGRRRYRLLEGRWMSLTAAHRRDSEPETTASYHRFHTCIIFM